MSDVEKYGLWAVIGFTGILVLIGLGGGEESEPLQRPAPVRPVLVQAPPAAEAAPAGRSAAGPAARPVAVRREGERAPPAGGAARGVFTVQPVTETGAAFRWDESPIPYPGQRSASGIAPATTEVVTHTIRKNETLGDISTRYFGTSTRWRELLVLNPGLDERRLKVGQTIVVKGPPPEPAATPATARAKTSTAPAASGTSGRTYVVQPGDTLGEIARKTLGTSRRSQDLYEANRHVLSSPDRLRAGQVLVLP